MAKPQPSLPLLRSEEQQLILDLGLEALRRINADRTWQDWMALSAALRVITEAAVVQAKSGPWHRDNKAAVRMFNGLWEHYEHSDGSNHKPLSSSERTALRFIANNPDVGLWRDTLDGTKRRSLNHPNAVVKAWRRATQTVDAEAVEKAKAKEDVLLSLERKLAEAEKQLRFARREAEWIAPQNLKEAKQAMVKQLTNVGIVQKVEAIRWVASRVGISDLTKLLAPVLRKQRRTYSRQ